MPMIEVDEEEFRRNSLLTATVNKWMQNPKSKRKLLEAHKAFDPKAEIPELDAPDPFDEKLNPVLTEVRALQKQLEDERADRDKREKLNEFEAKIQKGFAQLREEERLTADGEAAVRKIMEEEGITNPVIAFDHLQRRHPPQVPVTPGGSGAWNFMEPPPEDQKDLQALIQTKGESVSLIDKMARDALAEIRGQSRR